MEQKTTKIYLRTVIEFADENGYRIVGNHLQHDRCTLIDRDEIEESILGTHRPNLLVRCNVVGCGTDFRRTKSLDGHYEFLLVS